MQDSRPLSDIYSDNTGRNSTGWSNSFPRLPLNTVEIELARTCAREPHEAVCVCVCVRVWPTVYLIIRCPVLTLSSLPFQPWTFVSVVVLSSASLTPFRFQFHQANFTNVIKKPFINNLDKAGFSSAQRWNVF